MPSLSDSTTGSAILRANDATNEATATYNIYLIIESNDFEYTTEEGTPELLLNVTDPNGNPVENITGLVHYEDGFDITTRTGGFLLIPDYEITATDVETIQDWLIEVTFVNLDSDQNANTGKTLTGKLYITQDQMSSYELTEINNIESTTSYNSINATLDITNGSAAVSKYYYGIEEATGTRSAETVEYIESDEPSHTFSNLQPNSSYTIYSYVVDENDIKSNVYSTNVTTSEYEVPVINGVTHEVTLNSISLTVDASNGSNAIAKYMYSKDNGASWEESTSNTHTFNNLTDSTEYNIKVKVVDSEGYESTEYYEAITTEVYILPVVTSVNAETTWNSITLTPSGTNGTNTIDHYEYSINNGAYQTSNVFNSLSENTDYTIKVKAIDSIGRESNVYTTTVRTDTYTLPTISVSTSATENSITVRVNATPGDGSIVSYHYSRDNGSNYTTSTSNSYTFSGLTSGTTYYLKVYVTDSNGRTSTVYTTSQATTYINPSVSNVTATNITSNSITINVTASGGSNSISRYYYSSNNGTTWVNSTSSSYTFTNLSPETTYNFKVYVTDTAGHSSTQKGVSATTESAIYLANYIKSLYTSDGANGIYLHDGIGSYTNANLEAGDNSYRYAGANPNNYVCFGSDVTPCPNDNLYRIIGIFNINDNYQTKLIKNTSIGKYAWNTEYTTEWNTSDIRVILNNTYYNSLSGKYQNLIYNTTWSIGGIRLMNGMYSNAKEAYNYEIGANKVNKTDIAKVALMYLSDYYYSASPTYWNYSGNNIDDQSQSYASAKNENWIFSRLDEFTLSYIIDFSSFIFTITDSGAINSASSPFIPQNDVRPSFYLNPDVAYVSGDGTISNPYRIN